MIRTTATLILLLSAAAAASGQSLYTTTRGAATTGSHVDQQFEAREILTFDPLGGGQIGHHRSIAALTALLGDADGNGIHDDFIGLIDALAPATAGIDGGVTGFLFSIDRSMPTLNGTIEDGDIVALLPGGQIVEHFDESFFAAMTGTSTIDVDAFHLAADGTIWFSFSSDETTSSAALAAANGGDPVLDETTVFMVAPQATEATIYLDRTQVLAMVNQAMAANLTSVVDLTGFSPDHDHPGDWLFTTGSTNSLIEGKVFSSFGGGTLATLAAIPLDSTSFGFVDEEVMESLAVTTAMAPVFNLYGPDTTQAAPGLHAYETAGATPLRLVHLIASNSLFPAPPGEFYAGFTAFPWLVVNTSDAMLYASIQSLAFSAWSDPDGRTRIVFPISNIPSGIRITMQAIDLDSWRSSPPVTAWL